MNKNVIKRIICCFVFLLVVIPQVNSYGAESVHTLKGPERSKDEKKVTWDCVWYGSYPQSEIKQSNTVYKKLAACKEWNEDNDATIDGTKYRRVENSKEESGYKYYVYEPIKWRVLDVQGDMVTLLSDKVIEMEKFENGKIIDFSNWRG